MLPDLIHAQAHPRRTCLNKHERTLFKPRVSIVSGTENKIKVVSGKHAFMEKILKRRKPLSFEIINLLYNIFRLS